MLSTLSRLFLVLTLILIDLVLPKWEVNNVKKDELK